MEHQEVHKNSFTNARAFLSRGENWSTRRKKTLGADYKTNNKLKPDMTPGPRVEPGTPAGLDKGTVMSFCFSPRKCQATYAMPKRISCSIVEEPVGCLLFRTARHLNDTFKLLMHLIYQFVNLNLELKTAN